jgi:hypothetical protein
VVIICVSLGLASVKELTDLVKGKTHESQPSNNE